MINLSSYLTSGVFLKDMKTPLPYQCIIFETKPEHLEHEDTVIVGLKDAGYDFFVDGALQQYIEQYENTLLILDKIPVAEIHEILEETESELTVVNCNVGVSSYFHKLSPEIEDIDLLIDADCPLFEPYDKQSLLFFLSQTQKKYIRLSGKLLPLSLFATEEDIKQIPSLFNTTPESTEAADATIACSAYLLPELVGCCDMLEQKDHKVDLFLITDYHFADTEAFVSSLRKSKKLIIMTDHADELSYRRYWEALVQEHKLNDVNIHLLSPIYTKITSMLDEYVREQANYDAQALFERCQADIF